jgi:para-nitrobenzyl esterase
LYTSLVSAWREQCDRYRAAFPSTSPERLRETALSDWLYRIPTLHLAEAAHAGGAQVWLYELCWGFGSAGASHGLDTLLVFGTTHINTGLTEAGPQAVAESRQLSKLMRSEHLSFAAAGDAGWERYDAARQPLVGGVGPRSPTLRHVGFSGRSAGYSV